MTAKFNLVSDCEIAFAIINKKHPCASGKAARAQYQIARTQFGGQK